MPLPEQPQADGRKRKYRRWYAPVTFSLIANLIALGYAGDWFGRQDFRFPAMLSIKRIVLVQPPQVAPKPQRTPIIRPRPKPKPAPRDPNLAEPQSRTHKAAATARAGARHAPVPVVAPPIAPRSDAPRNNEKNVDRDPFQPDIAPAAVIPQPTQARNTVALPSPTTPKPPIKPVQFAPATGLAPSKAPVASPTPTPTPNAKPATGLAAEPGPARVGSGGQGQGDRGTGSGAGGVLPFGLGGGRGGDGEHHIVYLLDFSPSMTSRLHDLRIEIDRAMANLTPDDLFDIFAFGDHVVKMEDYLEPATPDSIEEANDFLAHMNQIDGTNIEQVMLEALNLHHTNEIVLITDGVPEDGETDFNALEREIRLANIHHVRIDTIGLVGVNSYNSSQDTFQAARLLSSLAHDSGGDYKEVPLGVDSSD